MTGNPEEWAESVEAELPAAESHREAEGIPETTAGLSWMSQAALAQQRGGLVAVRLIARSVLTQSSLPYLLGLMIVWFTIAVAVAPLLGVPLQSPEWSRIFVLDSRHPEYLWTWVTSIFMHGGVGHLFINGLVLASVGLPIEQKIGTQRFLVLFLVTALVAGGAQIGAALLVAKPMQLAGASGGIAGLFGLLLTLSPRERVWLFFLIPMRLAHAIPLFLIGSLALVAVFGVGAGGIGHIAHVAGALGGVVYGVGRDPASARDVARAALGRRSR